LGYHWKLFTREKHKTILIERVVQRAEVHVKIVCERNAFTLVIVYGHLFRVTLYEIVVKVFDQRLIGFKYALLERVFKLGELFSSNYVVANRLGHFVLHGNVAIEFATRKRFVDVFLY